VLVTICLHSARVKPGRSNRRPRKSKARTNPKRQLRFQLPPRRRARRRRLTVSGSDHDVWFAGVGASARARLRVDAESRRRGSTKFPDELYRGQPSVICGIEAAATGASIGASYLFHRTGHHRSSDGLPSSISAWPRAGQRVITP